MARCKNIQFLHQSLTTTYPEKVIYAMAADELAVPVTFPFISKTTGADAEALTLPNGAPGQLIVINLATDGGGDGTLTPDTSTGFSNIVFTDVGDQATLLFVDDTVGWIVLGLSSAPAITV